METLVSAKKQAWLSWFLRGILIFGFFILLGRLFELQLIKGDYFRALSDGNRVRKITIPAKRGRILSRDGEVLVGNLEVKKKIVLNPDKGYQTEIASEDTPEDEVIIEWVRDYKVGEILGHVSGYLGNVNEDEIGRVDPLCPEKGPRNGKSFLGRGGLEEEYNCILSGVDGEELIEVDTTGKKIRTIGRREPVPGVDIHTTISLPIQKEAYKRINGVKGSIIVSTPAGEILALVSSPGFDPNNFIRPENSAKVTESLNNKDLPLFNRAIGGLFHPGSVFKPVVAIAALEEKRIDQGFIYNDTGSITVNNFSYSNWFFTQYGGTEGAIELTRALARSTDTFFYKIGEMIGVNKLVEWTEKFGFSRETGIDIPGELAGLVPSPKWKLQVRGEPWFLGNTYHFSIGQGDLAVTPLSINQSIAIIANNGTLCRPHIVKDASVKLFDSDCKNLNIEKKNIDLVWEGMKKACEEGGTAYTFFDFSPKIACKTGTAEINEDGKTHAWFTLFGPIDQTALPEIVMTVLIEEGGEGSKVAGPVARDIMNFWKEMRP